MHACVSTGICRGHSCSLDAITFLLVHGEAKPPESLELITTCVLQHQSVEPLPQQMCHFKFVHAENADNVPAAAAARVPVATADQVTAFHG